MSTPDPEAPKLDPEPWLNPHAMTRQVDNRDAWRTFAPRPEYNQDREDYPNA